MLGQAGGRLAHSVTVQLGGPSPMLGQAGGRLAHSVSTQPRPIWDMTSPVEFVGTEHKV